MSRRSGCLLLAAFLLVPVVLLVAAYLALPSLSRTAAFRDALRDAVLGATGLTLELDNFEIAYDLSVTLENVLLRVNGAEPLLTAERIHAAPYPRAVTGAPFVKAEIEAAHFYLDRLPKPPGATKEDEAEPQPDKERSLWIPPVRLRLAESYVHHRQATLGPLDLELDVAGRDALQLTGTSVVAATGNEIGWNFTVDGPPVSGRGEVQGRFADLGAVLRAFAGIGPPEGTAAKTSEVHASIEAVLGPTGGVDVKAELRIDGLDAHDAEFLRVLENAKVRAALRVEVGESGDVKGRLDASAASGEALWDVLYVDLAKHAVRFRTEGAVGKERVRIENVSIEMKNVANLTAKGTSRLDGKEPKLDLRVSVPDLAPAFDLFVREPLRQSYPALAGTQVTGSAAARLSYESGRPARTAGRIDIQNGRIAVERPAFRIDGLNIDLPFQIGGAKGAKDETGHIVARELGLGAVDVGSVRLDLTAMPNRIFLRNAAEVPVLGGTFTLTNLSVEDIGEQRRRAKAGFSLAELDLRRLSEALDWPPFGGTVSGTIPSVTIAEDHAETSGEIDIRVFGGAIRIRNLRLDQILSPVPELSLDIDFHDLSLKRITKTFGVGHISGVLSGAFERLVIVRGQPVAFDGWVRTVERRGVAQKVSVKALRQISILGGAGGDAITRGILSMFEEYGYAKMGFRSRLRNDRFELEGVERVGRKDYLVVGSTLPPKVDVVSHSQVISFSEMMRRIESAIEIGGSPAADEE
jgi:hypothetical protein